MGGEPLILLRGSEMKPGFQELFFLKSHKANRNVGLGLEGAGVEGTH